MPVTRKVTEAHGLRHNRQEMGIEETQYQELDEFYRLPHAEP